MDYRIIDPNKITYWDAVRGFWKNTQNYRLVWPLLLLFIIGLGAMNASQGQVAILSVIFTALLLGFSQCMLLCWKKGSKETALYHHMIGLSVCVGILIEDLWLFVGAVISWFFVYFIATDKFMLGYFKQVFGDE